MIDLLKQEVAAFGSSEEKLHHAREFLQVLTLKIVYDAGYFENLAFAGGTALRFLFGLRRFSEDLDFSLTQKKGYRFSDILADLKRGFELNGLQAQTKSREVKTVQGAFIKFAGILKELGLSPLSDRKLSIKLEIDTNPPQGGQLAQTLVNKTFIFTVRHFDLSSLYATKLHACFFRNYTKGRDFYDLLWYLGKKTAPNFTLLNNAILQTQGHDPKITAENLNVFLTERLSRIDLEAAKKDVGKFLEDKKELDLFRPDVFRGAIAAAYGGLSERG